jgi:hypothetical protein
VTINSITYAAHFNNKNVGNSKPVTVTGVTLSGTDAGNYTVSQPAALTADVMAKNLTITGAIAISRTYDGSDAATVNFSGASLVGVVAPDVVTIDPAAYSAHFNNKIVGTSKPVTVVGVALSSADAGNYTVSQPSGLTADINALHVTGNFTASNKVYDATTAATVLTRTVSTTPMGDDVSLDGGTAAFADKNAGAAKTVTLTGATLTGADAPNYVLDSVATTTADITARNLQVAATGLNKVYDSNTEAMVTLNTDKLGSDDVTAGYTSANFADKNVGNGKSISVTGISISGGDATNYS